MIRIKSALSAAILSAAFCMSACANEAEDVEKTNQNTDETTTMEETVESVDTPKAVFQAPDSSWRTPDQDDLLYLSLIHI